ncbi:redoxin domain-containing protein, partial [Acinetobacter pittii]|uniref:redoxin domain-containing protein n=1 Tax=Acinetobacter pittii TaxID=48296 RepID=UPI0028134E33
MNIGDMAPDLLGLDEAGNEIRLSQYLGRKIILYFYPKDNTSGCTAEACSFRDHYAQ